MTERGFVRCTTRPNSTQLNSTWPLPGAYQGRTSHAYGPGQCGATLLALTTTGLSVSPLTGLRAPNILSGGGSLLDEWMTGGAGGGKGGGPDHLAQQQRPECLESGCRHMASWRGFGAIRVHGATARAWAIPRSALENCERRRVV